MSNLLPVHQHSILKNTLVLSLDLTLSEAKIDEQISFSNAFDASKRSPQVKFFPVSLRWDFSEDGRLFVFKPHYQGSITVFLVEHIVLITIMYLMLFHILIVIDRK